MTTTLTTSKGTFLFIGTNDKELKPVTTYVPVEYGDDWKFIGKTSVITEDQAREVVDGTMWLINGSYIETLRSLMQAERLYTENPFGNEKPKKIFHTQEWNPNRVTYEESIKQWQEAKSRTFPDWLIIKVK